MRMQIVLHRHRLNMTHKTWKVLQPPPEGINLGHWPLDGDDLIHANAFILRHAHMPAIFLDCCLHKSSFLLTYAPPRFVSRRATPAFSVALHPISHSRNLNLRPSTV